MRRFFVHSLDALDKKISAATVDFLDKCTGSTAYQFPYIGHKNELLFLGERDGQITFSGRSSLGYAASRYFPLAKVLTFNRGPVAKTPEEMVAGIEFVTQWAKKTNILRIEISPDLLQDRKHYAKNTLDDLGWNTDLSAHRSTLRMDLSSGECRLLSGLPGNTRYKIKRAAREGVEAAVVDSEEHLDEFYKLYLNMSRRKKLEPTRKDFFKRLWTLRADDPTRLTLVRAVYKNQWLGANLLFRSGTRVEYLFGAVITENDLLHGHVTAGYPLQWRGIQWSVMNSCLEYDFGGYDQTSKTGPAAMKRAFFRAPNPVHQSQKFIKNLMPIKAKIFGILFSPIRYFDKNG